MDQYSSPNVRSHPLLIKLKSWPPVLKKGFNENKPFLREDLPSEVCSKKSCAYASQNSNSRLSSHDEASISVTNLRPPTLLVVTGICTCISSDLVVRTNDCHDLTNLDSVAIIATADIWFSICL